MALLVNTPEATEFFERTHMESGLNLLVGEEAWVEQGVKPEYLSLRMEVKAVAGKVEALAKDKTRSEPERHAAAEKLSTKFVEKATKTRDAVNSRSKLLEEEAFREATAALGPKAGAGALESDIRSYVRQVAKSQDGLAKIRAAVAESEDAARVLYHSPAFLLELQGHTHEELRMEVLEKRVPGAYAKLNAAVQLEKVVHKLDDLVRRVPRVFFNPETAKGASTRVEV